MSLLKYKHNLRKLFSSILKIAGVSLCFVIFVDKSIFQQLIETIKNFNTTFSVETLITSILSLQQLIIVQQCSFLVSLGYLLFTCSLLAARLVGIILFVVAIIERIQPEACQVVCDSAEVVGTGSDIYLYTNRFIC